MIFEEKLIYFPSGELEAAPAALGLEHEEVSLVSSGGIRLHAWFLPARPGAGRFTMLVCHGNAGNISHRLERALAMHRELRADVLLFDYRGFGLSEGNPDEKGTYEDALAAYRYLTEVRGVVPERIVLFGESLGAAVAVELSSRVPAGALVLESPFTSIAAMAKVAYPFLPAVWVRTKYDNLGKIGRVSIPLLVIHGTRDETVPFAQGQELFFAAGEPKTFLGVEGAGHTDSYVVGGARYWNAWRALLESVEKR
jgi:fermentation-respiration switch protein FrsA (DUF1100 family)